MLFTFTVFALFNLFMIGILIHEKLDYFNQRNSPLGDNVNALVTAFNLSDSPIHGLAKYSNNKLQFLTDVCVLAQLPDTSYVKIILISGTYSDKCNLTATYALGNFNRAHVIFYSSVIVSSMVLLFGVLIFMLIDRFTSFKITYVSVYPTMLIPYMVSIILIILLLYDLISVVPEKDDVVIGENYYNNAYYILLWCAYIIINASILCKIIYDVKLPFNSRKNTGNMNLTSETDGSQYYYDE